MQIQETIMPVKIRQNQKDSRIEGSIRRGQLSKRDRLVREVRLSEREIANGKGRILGSLNDLN